MLRTPTCLLLTVLLAVLFFVGVLAADPKSPTNRRLLESRQENRLRRTYEEPSAAEPTLLPVEGSQEPTVSPVKGSEEPTGSPNEEPTGMPVEGSEEPTEAPTEAPKVLDEYILYMVTSAQLTMIDDDTAKCEAFAWGSVKDMNDLITNLSARDFDLAPPEGLKEIDSKDLLNKPEAVDFHLKGRVIMDPIRTGVDVSASAKEKHMANEFTPHNVRLLVPKEEKLILTKVTKNTYLFPGEGDRIGVYAQNPSDEAVFVELQVVDGDDFITFQKQRVGPKSTIWLVAPFTPFVVVPHAFVIHAKMGERVSNKITIKVGGSD